MGTTTTIFPSPVHRNWTTTGLPRPTRTTSSTAPPEYDYEEVSGPCDVFYDVACFSFGLNFYTVEFFIVLLLVLLHISMIVFIVVHGRQEKAFREAFYVQYAVVSVVDCLRMAKVSSVSRT